MAAILNSANLLRVGAICAEASSTAPEGRGSTPLPAMAFRPCRRGPGTPGLRPAALGVDLGGNLQNRQQPLVA